MTTIVSKTKTIDQITRRLEQQILTLEHKLDEARAGGTGEAAPGPDQDLRRQRSLYMGVLKYLNSFGLLAALTAFAFTPTKAEHDCLFLAAGQTPDLCAIFGCPLR